jgi:hypothetical protein
MGISPQQQVESIVRSLEEKGVPAAPVVKATALATSHPEAVSDLAIAVMRRFPKGGTFLDGAFSYLPEERWPELVHLAWTPSNDPAGRTRRRRLSSSTPACSALLPCTLISTASS